MSEPPQLPLTEISPEKARNTVLLSAEPTTALECKLQIALRREQGKNKVQKLCLILMQLAMVLNGAYIDLICGQLEAQEKKKSDKRKGRLFVNQVAEFERNVREKEEALKSCQASCAEKSSALKQWK
ncbi:hypothetical protein K438DRAFT_1756308 [Mycena galopus ATCC 62051]|nr:hypothetical protein K438DRAFT_1756308 [Mycena galopus ATCC 62051]